MVPVLTQTTGITYVELAFILFLVAFLVICKVGFVFFQHQVYEG